MGFIVGKKYVINGIRVRCTLSEDFAIFVEEDGYSNWLTNEEGTIGDRYGCSAADIRTLETSNKWQPCRPTESNVAITITEPTEVLQ
jgi:hypothetical protein